MSLAQAIGDGAENGAVQIGNRTFRYVYAPNLHYFGYSTNEVFHTFIRTNASKCRSLSLVFAASHDKPIGVDTYSLTDSAKIIQETRGPVTRTVRADTVVHVDVKLVVGESFEVQLRGNNFLYVNGSGLCSGEPNLVVGFD